MSEARDCEHKDLAAGWRSFLPIWGAPVFAAIAASLLPMPDWVAAAAWAVAFLWMGAACLVNASRCGRLHCYFSGPVLLLGALLASLIGSRVIAFGPHGLLAVAAATLTLAGLTFVLERVWGKYV